MTARTIAVFGRRKDGEEPASSVQAPIADRASRRGGRARRNALGSLIALANLVLVVGVALLVMALGGVLLHSVTPDRSLDIFRALHEQIVVGVLFGLSIFWLLPPHPWLRESEDREVQDPVKFAGGTEGGDVSNVTAMAEYRGREPSRRPRERGEVAG